MCFEVCTSSPLLGGGKTRTMLGLWGESCSSRRVLPFCYRIHCKEHVYMYECIFVYMYTQYYGCYVMYTYTVATHTHTQIYTYIYIHMEAYSNHTPGWRLRSLLPLQHVISKQLRLREASGCGLLRSESSVSLPARGQHGEPKTSVNQFLGFQVGLFLKLQLQVFSTI